MTGIWSEKGLHNYWGYNTLGFFAPEPSYASKAGRPSEVVREFKQMVKDLHNAGIEVILDVVYNHTAEGNHAGPTLSFRGIDNLAYYRTVPNDQRYYMDFTGCGNTLNMVHPHSMQLLMDSLRYWVTEMHVDGFRFDLASALARELKDVDQLGRVLRHDLPGSDARADQAHRRAVGPRRGRISGRQLPARLDGVERQVPRHGAQVLEGRHGSAQRDCHAPRGQRRSVRNHAAAAVGQRQFRHRPRWLHLAGPRELRAEA